MNGAEELLWNLLDWTESCNLRGVARDINTFGVAVGEDEDISGGTCWSHGALWDPAGDLISPIGDTRSAMAINEAGQVVLRRTGYGRLWHDGDMITLPFNPSDLNESGVVVGGEDFSGARVWYDGVVIELIDLVDPASGWNQLGATAGQIYSYSINDLCWIIGQGTYDGDTRVPYLIIPASTCPPDCPPDWNGDGVVDSDDLLDFLTDWAAGDADYNGDGVTDSDDLLEFLADWSEGC